MLTLLFIVLPIILVVHVVRRIFDPFRYSRRYYQPYGYNNGYGCHHHHRRHGLGGSLFSILALVALDRLFTGRRF